MDRDWLVDQLQEFTELIEETAKFRNPWGAERRALTEKIEKLQPVAREIMNNIEPGLGDYRRTSTSSWNTARANARHAIGMLRQRDTLLNALKPDSPAIDAAKLHPWVWDPAASFWDTQHYAEAVSKAWASINAHLQTKIGRRDVSDDDLVNQAMTIADPKEGQPRLRAKGDRAGLTWKSRQRGMLALAQGVVAGVRNPLIHEPDLELDEQTALEYLATLSVVARWVDEAEVESFVVLEAKPDL